MGLSPPTFLRATIELGTGTVLQAGPDVIAENCRDRIETCPRMRSEAFNTFIRQSCLFAYRLYEALLRINGMYRERHLVFCGRVKQRVAMTFSRLTAWQFDQYNCVNDHGDTWPAFVQAD